MPEEALGQMDVLYQRIISVEGFDSWPIHNHWDRQQRRGVGILVSAFGDLLHDEKPLFASGSATRVDGEERWSKIDGNIAVFSSSGIFEAQVSNYPENESAVTVTFTPYKELTRVGLVGGNVWWFTERDDYNLAATFVKRDGSEVTVKPAYRGVFNTTEELLTLVRLVKVRLS